MFGRKPKPQAAAPATQPRQSIYTTDGGHLASRGPLDRIAALRAAMPQPAPSASGVAMDSSTGLVPEFKQQIGNNQVPDAQFYWYASQGFISWQVAALMSQHWLVDKACNMPARDAVRVGYDVSLPEGTPQAEAILAEITKQDKRYKVIQAMREFVHMGRVYGVRVAIFRVRSTDPDYYEKPFNIDGVTPGAYMGISQVDPIWCVPELTDAALSDPAGLRFYEPEFYVIGGKRYHRSHLCVYIPHPVPDVLKPSYQYGGKSVPQLIYERVYASERTANEAPQLAMTKRLIVHKTDGAGFFSNLTKSLSRMLDFSQVRDNYGVMVIDKEADDISQHDTALTDLDATIMTQYQLVASIAEVPATKLLGTTPKGFNSTGDAEAEDYRIMLESIQTNDLQPLLDRHHQLVMRSVIRPKFQLSEDLELEASWRPLDSPTAAEWADVNLKKAQAAAALAQIGAIDGQDVREQLRRDKDSDYFGLVDDEPIDDLLTPDDDTVAGQDAKSEGWVTLQPSGSKVLLSGGAIVGGLSGKANGKKLEELSSKEKSQKNHSDGRGIKSFSSPDVAQEIKDFLDEDDTWSDFGLRIMPEDDDSKIGETLKNSYQWENGRKTKNELDGTSTIGVKSENVEKAIATLKSGGYQGKRVVLVRGESKGWGEDPGEQLIGSAEIVKEWSL